VQLIPASGPGPGTGTGGGLGAGTITHCAPSTARPAARRTAGPHRHAGRRRGARNLAAHQLTSNQIEFVNLIIGSLAEHGVVDAARLYESPFTGLAPWGPENGGQKKNDGQALDLIRLTGAPAGPLTS
jgi:hypothetical protein